MGADEADSILQLIHQSNSKTLDILEQAVFVNTLGKEFGLQPGEIASSLERSSAWVSVRLGIFDEMSESIRVEVFSGRFPVRAYMYTLRRFTRVNKIAPEEADRALRMLGSGEPAYADGNRHRARSQEEVPNRCCKLQAMNY
jgi:hypothetical protein